MCLRMKGREISLMARRLNVGKIRSCRRSRMFFIVESTTKTKKEKKKEEEGQSIRHNNKRVHQAPSHENVVVV